MIAAPCDDNRVSILMTPRRLKLMPIPPNQIDIRQGQRFTRLGALVLLATALTATGCRRCQKLEEQLCKDLASDCADWRAIGGPEEVLQDGHRRPDNACASILDSQLAYDGTLHTARIHVWVARLNDAIASGDVAERERIKEKLAELRRAGEDLRERLKKEVGR